MRPIKASKTVNFMFIKLFIDEKSREYLFHIINQVYQYYLNIRIKNQIQISLVNED